MGLARPFSGAETVEIFGWSQGWLTSAWSPRLEIPINSRYINHIASEHPIGLAWNAAAAFLNLEPTVLLRV
jgi:hypothetical protein